MQPSTERERPTDNRQAQNLPNPFKFTALRGCVQRLTTATLELVEWSEPDEWKKRLANTDKISPEDENKPFQELLRHFGVEPENDVASFIQPYMLSARWDRRVSHIEGFCAGGEFALQNAVPAGPETSPLEGTQEPEAWVSDRNWVDETLVGPRPDYPRILNNNRFHLVLQKKRFPEGSQGDDPGPPRRIYIKNPNGASVVAIIKTAPATHAEGFRDLFAGYITPTPEPNFILRESEWWGGCFIMSFNIPYYGISTRELQDSRTISNRGRRLRNRYELDFLRHGLSDDERPFFPDGAILHEAVYSLMVTCKSHKYWTVGCFDDDFFNEYSRLESDEDILPVEGETDPILLKAELMAKGNLTKSPRAYALAALSIALHKVAEHHGNIQDVFKASLHRHTSDAEDGSHDKISAKELQTWIEKFPKALRRVIHSNSSLVRKLDHFLAKDVVLSPDAQPQGVLWRSLQRDPDALRSLFNINQYLNQLLDIDGELRQLEIAWEEVRRKRKTDNEGEQQTITKQVYQIAIAAFAQHHGLLTWLW
ncbi:hypothetical protein ACHAPT_000358 [Fusarium lateritium]